MNSERRFYFAEIQKQVKTLFALGGKGALLARHGEGEVGRATGSQPQEQEDVERKNGAKLGPGSK